MLAKAIAAWDGKATDYLHSIYTQYSGDAELTPILLTLLSDASCSDAASWLLKYHRQHGGSLAPEQLNQLAKHTNQAMPWQTQLHILQLLKGYTFSERQKQYLAPFSRQCIQSNNKFVRAWAYNLLHELSLQFADLQKDANDIITAAKRDEAPSVKARLRHLAETP
ncbi:hypothetical protein QWI17_18885 [Gilvimarinus sp. SDUM040013]|uniref:HEAT repeat domain-containing protein n=1 Tax=Gilvimarinus gilvus TaxID=3058038 RepID=A0ABU4RX23_9GAMM|nr:hypothetical protein [Gilvimarinus sp. SDUM040013]MDO3387918.1 hypothetical protein [Gilvimarinus sp. SDUM040013]MDX6848711.1 hypothetical protein [Gilvimarinus sp. SDUM040013]